MFKYHSQSLAKYTHTKYAKQSKFFEKLSENVQQSSNWTKSNQLECQMRNLERAFVIHSCNKPPPSILGQMVLNIATPLVTTQKVKYKNQHIPLCSSFVSVDQQESRGFFTLFNLFYFRHIRQNKTIYG